MTIAVLVFLAFGIAFLIALNWADARRRYTARRPRIRITGSDPESQWCPSCRQHWTYLGDPFDAWLAHCRDVCPTTRAQR